MFSKGDIMGIKKQLLFATLFASSCLLSTTVVKADTTNVQEETQPTQQVQQPVSQATQTKDLSGDAVESSSKTETDQTQSVQANKQNDTQNSVSTQADSQAQTTAENTQVEQNATTQATQVQNSYQDTAVNGVFTIGNQTVTLYDNNGNLITNRRLMANTAWRADYRRVNNANNKQYYRVATTEYVDATTGTYKDYAQPYSGVVTVVYKKGASVHDFQGFGDKAVYLGNNLPTGSSWKVNSKAQFGGKNWYQVGKDTWLPQDYVVESSGQYKEANWLSGVPLISQRPELPNGCEITAVTMMLQYAGAKVNKMQMAREMPRSGDPNYGYIGQPWDGTGITIFPSALMSLVEKYAGSAKDLTGQTFNAVKYQINIGHPVVTWNTLHGFPYHALVVTGYDKNYVYYNDCWTNQTTQMGINQFINNWNTQRRRAISY